ncbi:hypothetical protein NL676_002090 [Syzygium grande]|nr:hypothetical protein NL676_002090 [Syzygium grande]
METLDLAILLTALVTLYYFFLLLRLRCRNSKKLPPGPTALPIIGNLHQLRDLPHRRLHRLAKTFGPIMFLRLGNKPTVVVSSPEAAELVLKTHDAVFLGRPKGRVTHHLTYGNRGMAFTEGGAYWQSTRKLCALRLLSPAKVDSYAPARREELGRLIEKVRAAAAAHEVVDVSAEVGKLMGNLSCRLILGCGSNSGRDEFDLKPLIHEVLSLAGAFNLADYVPLLGPFDLQGLARRAKVIHRAIDKVLEGIIKEHEQDTTGKYKGDFLDTILSVMDQPMTNAQDKVDMLDLTNVKAIVLDLISGSYGRIYIDFDVIVLKSLSSLNNTVGLESQLDRQSLNGAVMAFRRHSPFIMKCLREFYSVYDDTQFRWNGADLLTRVAENFSRSGKREVELLELKVLPFVFFPTSSQDITRYLFSLVYDSFCWKYLYAEACSTRSHVGPT